MMKSNELERIITSDKEGLEASQLALNVQQPPQVSESAPQNQFSDLVFSKEKLAELKENMNKMIDLMADHPSFFSRAATYWGELSIWLKILAGVVLIVPTLLIAIFVHVFFLFAVSAITLIVYVGSSLLLDNHHNSVTHTTESLKDGIGSLADLLGTVIESLDKFHKDMQKDLKRFQDENDKLAKEVSELDLQITEFSEQNAKFKKEVLELEASKDQLQTTVEVLTGSVESHSALLETAHKKLEQTQEEYQKSQEELNNKIVELDSISTNLKLRLQEAKDTVATLTSSMQDLTSNLIGNDETREAYLQKLDEHLKKRDASFTEITGNFSKLELELAETKKQLEQQVEKHKALLTRQEILTSQLAITTNTLATLNHRNPLELGGAQSTLNQERIKIDLANALSFFSKHPNSDSKDSTYVPESGPH